MITVSWKLAIENRKHSVDLAKTKPRNLSESLITHAMEIVVTAQGR